MAKDTQCRKWNITINNPVEKEMGHENLKKVLNQLPHLKYWCMSDEIGEEGTYHTHFYFALENGIRFSRVKNIFEGAHIEMANGSHQENRDYVFKEGKWAKSKKKETNLPDTHEEFGEMPIERKGNSNAVTEQYDMVKQGMTNYEILEQFDGNVDLIKLDRMRLIYLSEKYKSQERDIKVIYCFGVEGTGKTTSIFKLHGYENVYKVDEWDHPFDSYECQSVILFDDWRHTLTKITDMLRWIDRFPLKLPCRYAPKQACYETVYITSNEPLEIVYNTENSMVHETTRKALLRRIHEVWVFKKDFTYKKYKTQEYLDRDTEFVSVKDYDQEELPFN